MAKALFSVSCTTCRARLSVRNQDAIGEILECPKCGSMVLIVPPDGWVPPQESAGEPKPTDIPSPNPAVVAPAVIPPTTSSTCPAGTASDASASAKPPSPPQKKGDSSIGCSGPPVVRESASEKPIVEPPPVRVPVMRQCRSRGHDWSAGSGTANYSDAHLCVAHSSGGA